MLHALFTFLLGRVLFFLVPNLWALPVSLNSSESVVILNWTWEIMLPGWNCSTLHMAFRWKERRPNNNKCWGKTGEKIKVNFSWFSGAGRWELVIFRAGKTFKNAAEQKLAWLKSVWQDSERKRETLAYISKFMMLEDLKFLPKKSLKFVLYTFSSVEQAILMQLVLRKGFSHNVYQK